MYFIQTPRSGIIFSGDKAGPAVYLDVPHSKDPKPSCMASRSATTKAVTRLVVDTIGLNDKSFVDNFRTPAYREAARCRALQAGRWLEALDVHVWIEDAECVL